MRNARIVWLAFVFSCCALSAAHAQSPAVAPPAAAVAADSGDAVLRIDGDEIGAEEFGRWLLSTQGERLAYTFATDLWVVEDAARRQGVTLSTAELDARVDAQLKERIERAFFGRKALWLEELATTGRSEGGVRRQREIEARPILLATKVAAIDRVVPEHKIVREWELAYGRNGRRYTLSMIKFQVVVPNEDDSDQETWRAARDAAMEAGRQRAAAARARIVAGEDFGRVAREVSEDDDTRDGRGRPAAGFTHVGWPPRFMNELETLAVGALSEPIYARGGFWILRVEDVKVTPLDSVREELRKMLAERGPEEDEQGAVMARARENLRLRVLPGMFKDDPDPERGGSATPVIEINGEIVTRAEYSRWLVHLHGESLKGRFAEDRAVEQRAREKKIAVTPEEVAARVEANTQAAIAEGFERSRPAWELLMRLTGREEATWRSSQEYHARIDLLCEKLMQVERPPAQEAQLLAHFKATYGENGHRRDLRWIVRMIKVGDIDPQWSREQLDRVLHAASEQTRAIVKDYVDRARAGESFADIARRESDDAPTKSTGGAIQGPYRANRWPEQISSAIEKLEKVGDVTEPLLFGSVWVSFQLSDERRVRFEDVKADLAEDLRTRAVKGGDMSIYRNSLVQQSKIEILPGLSR